MLLNSISIRQLKNNNKGSATIVALVSGVVIMAFALSLLMVAYSLYAAVSRQNVQEQCRQISESTAVSLGKELLSEDNRLAEYLKEQRHLTGNNRWIATVERDDDEFAPANTPTTEGREELDMEINLSDGKLGNYTVMVTFSYTEDVAYEDEEPDDGAEEPEEPTIQPDGQPEDSAIRVLHAKIKTSRGTDAGRDYQESIVEKDYRNIDF